MVDKVHKAEAIDDQERNVRFLSDRIERIFDAIRRTPKRKRSRVEYVPLHNHDNLDTDDIAVAHILLEMASDVDPYTEISPETANGHDPGAEISMAAANGDDPDAEMHNGDNPDVEIPAEAANGGYPDVEIGNREVPDVEMGNREDPDEEGGEEMPANMREHIVQMGGYRLQLIMEKNLTATDLRTDQGRLMLPPKQVRVEFLTADEERYLQHRDEEGEENNGLNYMDTFIVGEDLAETPIVFKKWLLGSKYTCCFMKFWNSFARTQRLKTGNTVRIWSFRVDRIDYETNTIKSELRFALIKL